MLSSGSRRFLLPVVGIGVGCGALTAYSQLSVQNYESSQNIAVASHRVFNLATCVTKVCASYLYHNICKHERGDSEFSRLEAELTRLQDEERQMTLRYNASGYTDMEAYRREGDDVRERILAVADRLASSKQELLSRVHTISAEAFRDLCMRNRGVYIKLGQHLSQLDYILPPEYCSVLSDLLDKNPASNFESVCSLFQEEFPSSSEGGSGALPADLFASFDPVPIASASLAQVHVATGRDGQRYAVKVQHPSLRRQAAGDLVAIARALEFVSWVFPSFKYQWLLREMTNNLPVELDFCHEAANMERCRSMLHKEILVGDVVVPTVAPELSSSRVLTMSFEDGVSIGGLSKKFAAAARGEGAGVGYRASDVAQLVSSVFAEQIFRHGFVHCDPHEANLHVRAHPTRPGRPQLILLDHGLYRELGPDFRHHYTRLWSGVAGSDFSTIERECGALHVTSSVSLFSALLTMKPWSVVMSNDMNSFHPTSSKKKRTASSTEGEMMRRYAIKYQQQVQDLLNSLPSDMILLFKTNDCLRHIDSLLGAPVNTITVVATITADIILEESVATAVSSEALSIWDPVSWSKAGWTVGGALAQWTYVRTRVAALGWAPQLAALAHEAHVWGTYLYPRP